MINISINVKQLTRLREAVNGARKVMEVEIAAAINATAKKNTTGDWKDCPRDDRNKKERVRAAIKDCHEGVKGFTKFNRATSENAATSAEIVLGKAG